MFEFEAEQKTYEIHGVKIGGQPGEVPTVMIGSLFYKGHRIVEDPGRGVFDGEEAERLITTVEEQTDKTGLPSMIDLVAENARAVERYLDFVTGVTDMPVLLDLPSEKEQVESLQYAHDQGVMDRIVLNSLNPHTKDQVYQKLKDVRCENAMLLLYSSRSLLSSDKSSVLEELLPRAREAGIGNVLVDTVVIDIPTLGLASKAVYRIKDQYGYPTGCGAHNAIPAWRGLRKKFVRRAVTASLGVVNALPVAQGADFVFFGPIENAEVIYPSVALVDTAYSQLIMEKGGRIGREHPRYRIG